jgi:hypothetical protein
MVHFLRHLIQQGKTSNVKPHTKHVVQLSECQSMGHLQAVQPRQEQNLGTI